MAFYKCDFTKISAETLAVIQAVESLFLEQSMTITVTSIDPIKVNLKATLSDTMIKRLFVDRVPMAAHGYEATHEDGYLVIQKKDDQPVKKRRTRGSKGDSDIQSGEN